MDEKFISSMLIEKLGHNILEIRVRALDNIISKLERGFLYDNKLARSKELLIKLLNWFKFDVIAKEEEVLRLLQRIINSNTGTLLVKLFGKDTLNDELLKIQEIVGEKGRGIFDKLLKSIECVKVDENIIVPPLDLDGIITNRSEDSLQIETYKTNNDTQYKSTLSYQEEQQLNNELDYEISPCFVLTWQPLTLSDRNVLETLQEKLRNAPEPSLILDTCDFFASILLHDFPAEVFLQRSSIVNILHELLWSSPSSRITTSILKSLEKLTSSLIHRIHFYRDPAVYNNKQLPVNDEPCELRILQRAQITIPDYCLKSIHSVLDYLYISPGAGDKFTRKKCQIGINSSLQLLKSAIDLFKLCVGNYLFVNANDEFPVKLNDVFVKFGDVLQYYRLQSIASDWSGNYRFIHLYLLCTLTDFLKFFIRDQKFQFILPENLKIFIADSLLDAAFAQLFPNIYNDLVKFTQILSENSNLLGKYEEITKISKSMTSAVKFINNWKQLPFTKSVSLLKESLSSLEFHKNLEMIKVFFDICANKYDVHSFDENILNTIDEILITLLSHSDQTIKYETYKLCHKNVISALGAKLNVAKLSSPGKQSKFLLRSKIMQEIILFGLIDLHVEVQNFAEDILIHILKCKILVSDSLWEQILLAMIPNIPNLLCYVNGSQLGSTILSILDPDKSVMLKVPNIDIFKGNLALLFLDNSQIREEAVSRICWELASRNDKLLPRINNLHDKTWAGVCHIDRRTDYKVFKCIQHFYQPSGIHKVLELLNSKNIEPVIRRSAVTQLSVMLEDPILHPTFLEQSGVELIKSIMLGALIEDNYNDYPDSIISCISILKHIVLYNLSVRINLGNDFDLLCYIIRGLFLYFTEIRMKDDASTLLFLLLFNKHLIGSPLKNDLSIPQLIYNKLRMPFECHTYWKESPHKLKSVLSLIENDKWYLKTLQIHWNSEWFGGINKLLSTESINYTSNDKFNNILKLNQVDIQSIKTTCVEYCIKHYLEQMQCFDNHNEVILNLQRIELLIYLNSIKCDNNMKKIEEINFERHLNAYLIAPPSSAQDYVLLTNVLKLMKAFLSNHKDTNTHTWIITFLQSKQNFTSELLQNDSSKDPDCSNALHSLLEVIKLCITISNSDENTNGTQSQKWIHLADLITQCLHFEDSNYFYDLVYLNNLLSTLVLITSRFGWSNSKAHEHPNKCLSRIHLGLFRLLESFYCGKGVTAGESFMGLSIIRHVVLILNHTIHEMQHANVKNWEKCLMDEELNVFGNLASLQTCRDVVVRAALYQYFAGLALSKETGTLMIKGVRINDKQLIEASIALIIDHNEASLVKENVVNVLTNLLQHIALEDSNRLIQYTELNGILEVFNLLTKYNCYKDLGNIYTNLYCDKYYFENFSYKESQREDMQIIITPGFIKSINLFLYNLLLINPSTITTAFNSVGLTKLLFRCLTIPSISIDNSTDFLLYNDILQMNATILELLVQLAQNSEVCCQKIINTRDYLVVMISLLNSQLYYKFTSELVFIRNKLWSAIFNFIDILLSNDYEINGYVIICNILNEKSYEDFLTTLCEALLCFETEDLQFSALSALISILQFEKIYTIDKDFEPSISVQTLLDTKTSPRSFLTVETDTNSTPIIERDLNKFGDELCRILLKLYDSLSCKKLSTIKKRFLIINAISSLLLMSFEAKQCALKVGLLHRIIMEIKEIQNRLNLESVDFLRRQNDKKRIQSILKDLEHFIGLLTNFMFNDELVKKEIGKLDVLDVLHKLWVWFMVQKNMLSVVLKMLCTLTTKCIYACSLVPFTNGNPGSGPRKIASSNCILECIVKVLNVEMNQISRTHDLSTLHYAFEIIENVLVSIDCRFILTKINVFNNLSKLHPLITKRQKPWDAVELIWLKFIREFTIYTEGQTYVIKLPEVLDIIMLISNSTKNENRRIALEVLRNLSFHHQNRTKLLASDAFIQILHSKLNCDNVEESFIIASIITALASNNQKAKLILKCANIHVKLVDIIKVLQFSNSAVSVNEIEKLQRALHILKEGE